MKSVLKILGLTLLVVGVSEGLAYLDRGRPHPPVGAYLVKYGAEYLTVWKEFSDPQYQIYRFENLQDARHHLERLHLVLHHGQKRQPKRLNGLWLRPAGAYTSLYWKVVGSSHLQRLTFRTREEARFFFEAFEAGAYTASPFGHAVLFVPR